MATPSRRAQAFADGGVVAALYGKRFGSAAVPANQFDLRGRDAECLGERAAAGQIGRTLDRALADAQYERILLVGKTRPIRTGIDR